MRFKDFGLQEASVPRNQFDAILRDPNINLGFECEVIFDRDASEGETEDANALPWEDLLEFVELSRRNQTEIDEAYHEWLSELVSDEWERVKRGVIRQYCIDNDLFTRDGDGDIEDEDDTLDANESDARDEWEESEREDIVDGKDMDDFISAAYGSNEDFMREFLLVPTYGWADDGSMRTNEGRTETEVHREMAREIGEVLDVPVDYLEEYHEVEKSQDRWYVEPDGSLKGNGKVTGEVVSSVYNLADGLEAMTMFFEFIEDNDHDTNESTGLHINLSIEGKDESDFDYLKMILFYDERHVAALFDRLENTYAEQMRDVLFGRVQQALNSHGNQSVDPHEVMDGRDLAKTLAALKKIGMKLIPLFDKYYSIRNRDNGVFEFRSMGNAGYHRRIDDIRKRVINMAYIMKIGSDDSARATEYVSKVYGLLANRKYDAARLKEPLPAQLSSLEGFLASRADAATLARENPLQFLAVVAEMIIDHKTPLNPTQRRQIKALVVRARLQPQAVSAYMREELYNTIALMLGWPIAVPDREPNQPTLPFAVKGHQPDAPTRPARPSDEEAEANRREAVIARNQPEMFQPHEVGYDAWRNRQFGYRR